VAVKAGRSRVGAPAATSHTGALAASDAIVDALLRQCGVIRTDTIEELFDVTTVLSRQPVPEGPRVAILTNAGGPGILAADACEARSLDVAALSPDTTAALRAFLPAAASVGNPVDIIASASAADYERALELLLADPGIDSVIVVFIPPMVTSGVDVAAAITRAAGRGPSKTLLAVFMSSEPASALLGAIPAFAFPESAAAALARVVRYGEWRRSPDGVVPEFADAKWADARAIVGEVIARGGGWVTPSEGERLLDAAGIAVVRGVAATDEAGAVAAAERARYPVALKAFGPTIVHKSEMGALRLNLRDAGAVASAFRELRDRLGPAMTGALVQPMVMGGVEMLVGAVEDPVFGPVVACALGGTATELLGDSAFRLAPLTDRDARLMIDALKSAPLLRGYRGAPVADEPALRDALLRISALATACPEIREIEINPLRVRTEGVVALDVRAKII
jgi:acyl-CoA synthetase (NDP forming)